MKRIILMLALGLFACNGSSTEPGKDCTKDSRCSQATFEKENATFCQIDAKRYDNCINE